MSASPISTCTRSMTRMTPTWRISSWSFSGAAQRSSKSLQLVRNISSDICSAFRLSPVPKSNPQEQAWPQRVRRLDSSSSPVCARREWRWLP